MLFRSSDSMGHDMKKDGMSDDHMDMKDDGMGMKDDKAMHDDMTDPGVGKASATN